MADVISTLPDAILCHILDFLQTKQSVATSILSKRWNTLWLSVPTLRFQQKLTKGITTSKFNDFVYSVLVLRDVTLPIKTFHLDVTYIHLNRCPMITITKWIKFAIQQRVEYLYLHLKALLLPKLPITILTCKTLVVLKLFSFSVKEGLSDSSVLLPSLKTLHLEDIWFSKLGDFTMFLSGCPILEDLRIFEVEFTSNESLTTLTCSGWNNFCLTNLTRADIDWILWCFLLKTVHNTHSLRLTIHQRPSWNELIPTFHDLTQLELISFSYSWQLLVKLLNHCPKLQKLHIAQAEVDKEEIWTRRVDRDDKEDWVDPDVVPQCLSLHLTTCNLFNFLGLQGEILLVRYILRNAEVLQTMKIRKVGRARITRLISSFPRASVTCKVTIC